MKEFFYKYGLIIFLILTISVLAIQKEAVENKIQQSKMIPDQTVVISAILHSGISIPVIVLKGSLNPENENKTWITLEDFKKRLKNKPRVDNRHKFEANKGRG